MVLIDDQQDAEGPRQVAKTMNEIPVQLDQASGSALQFEYHAGNVTRLSGENALTGLEIVLGKTTVFAIVWDGTPRGVRDTKRVRGCPARHSGSG